MVSKKNERSSIYGDYIVEQVTAIARAGGHRFTVHQLAVRLGLKVTHNFRRRIFTLQDMGLVQIDYATTLRGGLGYSVKVLPAPDVQDLSDIPF